MKSRRLRAVATAAVGPLVLLAAHVPPLGAQLEIADPHVQILASPITTTGDASASFVEERNGVVLIMFAGAYDRSLAEPRAELARTFYEHNGDDYDFLVVFTTFQFPMGGAAAFASLVRNDVRGIGLDLFDNGAAFGSGSRLGAIVDMGRLADWSTQPSEPRFETTLTTLLHELQHRWGSRVRFRAPDGTLSTALLGRDGSHWSYLLDSDASVHYGHDWRDNGDGSFTADAVERRLSPLDLYLAGFAPPSEVAPFFLVENPSVDPRQLPQRQATVIGTKQEVTIDQVIAAEGPRLPAAGSEPLRMRIAFLLVARPGETVTEAQVEALSRVRRELPARFAAATGGRGIVEISAPRPDAADPGAPDPLAGGDPRPAANLDAARAWIRSRQAEDGSWQDRSGTQIRDTAMAMLALASDEQFTGRQRATDWLASRQHPAVDGLARRLALLGSPGLAPPLLALQNADGGWGVAPGYHSDPLDTALALAALAEQGPGPAVAAAAAYLVHGQNSDGGWGTVAGGASRTSVTALALRALLAAKETKGLSQGTAFLLSGQNADGGFGDSPSTSHDTALVLETLRGLGALEASVRENGLRFLSTRQDLAGSWEGSVYSTAVTTLALEGLAAPPPPPPVDLEVLAGDLTLQGSARVGLDATFRATMRNRGTEASPPFRARFRVSDGTTTKEVADLPLQVDAGESITRDLVWRVDLAGELRLTVELDHAGDVTESEEENNVATLVFHAEPPAGVGLAVAHGDIVFSPDPAREGRPLGITASVRNLGSASARDVVVAFIEGDPASGGLEIARATVPVLGAGISAAVSVTWPRVSGPADRQVHVVVDPEDAIAEPDEGDNTAFRSLSVLSLPDLTVGSGSIRIEPRFPVAGQPTRAAVVVANLGEQETTFTVRLLGGAVAGAGAPLAVDRELTVAGNGSAAASFEWIHEDATSVLTAMVDPSGAVEEASEANNRASLPVNTQQGDFFVDERHFSPNGDGVRDRTTFFFSLESAATVAVEVWDPQREEVVRRHTGPELQDVHEGSFTWDGRDAAGRVVRDTTWVLRAVDETGRELGSSWAVVDNDRSSLLAAAGTPYELVTNLTCTIDEPEDPVFTADEQWLYFMMPFASTPPHLKGIYRVRPNGADLQAIVPTAWFGSGRPQSMTVSPDGAHVLFSTEWRELWIVQGAGGTPRRLGPTTTPPRLGDYPWDVLGFDARGRGLFRDGFGGIFAVAPAGGTPTQLIRDSNILPPPVLSPTRKHILVQPFILNAQIVDLARDTAIELESAGLRLTDFAWSGDGTRVAATFDTPDGGAGPAGVLVFDTEGRLLQRLDVAVDPRDPFFDAFYASQPADAERPASLDGATAFAPAWPSASEVAFVASWTASGPSTDLSALVASAAGFGDLRTIEWLPYRDQLDASTAARSLPASARARASSRELADDAGYPTFSSDATQLHPFWYPILHGDPAGRSLLLRPTDGYLLDEKREADVMASPEGGFPVSFSPSGRHLLIARTISADDPPGPCRGRSLEEDLYSVRSLHNLTAELRSTSTTSIGVVFEGTASDLHFASWRLDYASADAAGEWRPIVPPSDVPVLGGWLATWAPPGAGTFHVRLLVEDLAGNTRSRTRTLTFAETPTVTDLYLSPRFISPNGDGVLEMATLRYRVLQPAHLLVEVRDAQGRSVRRFQRDHAQAGATSELIWDGRDDSGGVVADGEYTVALLGYELLVRVDNKAPTVTLSVTGPEACRREHRRDVGGTVKLTASDATEHLAPLRVSLERGEGESPSAWLPALGGEVPLPDLVGYRYRARAFDAAGNRTIVTSGMAAERLLLLAAELAKNPPSAETCGATPSDPIEPQALRLLLAEAVRSLVHQVFVQYQTLPVEESDWIDVPLQPALPLDRSGRFDLIWDMAGVSAGQTIAVRVRALDAAGGDHFSPSFVLDLDGLSLDVLSEQSLESLERDDPATAGSLRSLLRSARLDAARDRVLWGRALLPADSGPVRVLVSSPEGEGPYRADPTYQPPVAFGTVASGTLFLVPLEPTTGCHRYVAQAITETPTGSITSDAVEVTVPCLGLAVELKRPAPVQCGGPPTAAWPELRVTPRSLDGQPLQLLTVHGPDRDGQRTLLLSENRPADGVVLTYQLDLDAMAEGGHLLDVALSNVSGERVVEETALRVDRIPPNVGITYPIEGQRVCGTPRNGSNVIDIEGFVRDDQEIEGFAVTAVGARTLPTDSGDPGAESGVIGSIADGAGDVTVRLAAWDFGGNTSCAETAFHFDGIAEAEPRSGVLHILSPDGDGVRDSVELVLDVEEPGDLAVDVHQGTIYYDFARETVDCRATSEVVRALMPATPASGPTAFSWAGEDDAGDRAPDGEYIVWTRLRDACGNETRHRFCVATDTTPPEVEVTSPSAGATLPLIVEIQGTVWDDNAVPNVLGNPRWRLEYGMGAAPDSWSLISQGTSQKRDAYLGRWNTLGLSGAFTLRLVAVDQAGNESAAHVPVTLTSPAHLVADLGAEPRLFSPNGDGRREQTAIRYTLAVEGLVDLAVEKGGAVVRRLLLGAQQIPGTRSVPWDGRSDDGSALPDGEYRVTVTVRLPSQPQVTQSEQVTVAVDSTPPVILVDRPGPFAAPGSPVVGSVTDQHLESLAVELTDTPGAPVWREIFRDTRNRASFSFATLEGLDEGDYALRFTARDQGEIVSERVASFEIDATSPGVEIDSPLEGEVVGAAEGVLAIDGSASDAHLASWRLELGAGATPAAWILLAEGTSSSASTTLHRWTPTGISDGAWVLRLTAGDKAGLRTEARRSVVVDNTPPHAVLSTPTEGSWVRRPISILGTASDAHLVRVTVAVAPGPPGGATLFAPIREGLLPVSNGELATWSALPPDGEYTLRLRSEDAGGNRSEVLRLVRVDTAAPAPPTGLVAVAQGRDAQLHWSASPSPDVAGYVLLRNGVRLWGEPRSGTSASDLTLEDGLHRYALVAVDRAGWESVPSDPAELTIDLDPPLAVLHTPAASARVAGLVTVTGIAASPDDFREYRLSVSPATGGGWQELRRSAAPVRAGPLGEWSTIGLAEEAGYRIRLEAEDTRGNVAAALVEVTIDNQRPAPPTGLQALLSGATANLSWNPNVEPDLAGYLLYRDGRLANATGPVIDDLTQFLLRAPSYADANLPDGTFRWVLHAVDLAGNVSDPSVPASATLDRRAPAARIVVPAAGTVFDGELYLLATTPDTDVASVRFEQSADGASLGCHRFTGHGPALGDHLAAHRPRARGPPPPAGAGHRRRESHRSGPVADRSRLRRRSATGCRAGAGVEGGGRRRVPFLDRVRGTGPRGVCRGTAGRRTRLDATDRFADPGRRAHRTRPHRRRLRVPRARGGRSRQRERARLGERTRLDSRARAAVHTGRGRVDGPRW